MKLWVESAHQVWPAADRTTAGAVSTLSTEDQFAAAVVSRQGSGVRDQESVVRGRPVQRVTANLVSGASMDAAVDDLLAALPAGEHVSLALLEVRNSGRASLAEVDAPPLFMARRGDFVLLPVVEEERAGRLVRRCDFSVQEGDHLAMVSESYIRGRGGVRPWSWRDIAVSIRRLTSTGCDAEQLMQALVRSYERFAVGRSAYSVVRDAEDVGHAGENALRTTYYAGISVLAMFVRPMRTATIWSGPPANRAVEEQMLAAVLAEEDLRIICGDTTAEIAARLLGAKLVMEPPPAEGWTEVPPVSRMIRPDGSELVALVTEGVVTMGVASQRLAEAKRPRDLAGREDGASRLVRLLLTADKMRFVVGTVVNPAQTERDGTPLRKAVVERLATDLRVRGKLVTVEHF